MHALRNIGIAKRLVLIVITGALALAALALIAGISQDRLMTKAYEVARLQAGLAALNHLDTRQSELKVDAYRAALGRQGRTRGRR